MYIYLPVDEPNDAEWVAKNVDPDYMLRAGKFHSSACHDESFLLEDK